MSEQRERAERIASAAQRITAILLELPEWERPDALATVDSFVCLKCGMPQRPNSRPCQCDNDE